ncbi:MAG: hypothetical protein O4859_28735 [Trichodesmium sp. St18_bin1]|nr:hypothetical protein [Trichodesmium sp. St18_bin1]
MHATSLQGFGYGDVVHQFENCYKQAVKVIQYLFWLISLLFLFRVDSTFRINIDAKYQPKI